MVGVAGQRWRIEECFQFAKDQLGLGDYEVRSWTGWHRHVTLVLAAGGNLYLYCVIKPNRLENSQLLPFFPLSSGLAVWLRSKRPVDSCPVKSSRTQAMGLEVVIPSPLVFRAYPALVFLAQGSSGSSSLSSLP